MFTSSERFCRELVRDDGEPVPKTTQSSSAMNSSRDTLMALRNLDADIDLFKGQEPYLLARLYRSSKGASQLTNRKNGRRMNGMIRSCVWRSVVTKFSFQFLVTNLRSSVSSEKHRVCGLRSMLIGAGEGSGLMDRKDRCLEIVLVSVLSRGRGPSALLEEKKER